MNQKIAFYLLSIIAIFFIGYYYSQFNIEPLKPEIITINNKDEIEQYAQEHSIEWREDTSNNKTTYLRNNLRHSIIPLLKEINPSFIDSFKKTQEYLNESQSVLEDYILEIEEYFFHYYSYADAELDIELIKFDLEIAEALLKAK